MKRHSFAAVLLILTASLLATVPPAGAEVLVFDMGTPTSLVHPGARQVLVDNAAWRSTQGLQGHDGPGQGTPLWTNPLNQDSIMGRAPNAFRFDAAPGPWSVHVICGFGSQWPSSEPQYWSFGVTVGADSWPVRISASGYGGEYRMEHHTFDVVSDGSIEVQLDPRSRWCLSGIVAWQPQDEAAAIEVIDEVERWAPDEELAKWREEPDLPTGPEPPLAESDQQRGFYLWHRHWANPIYPQTNPAPGEMNPTLRLFASPGEYEPLTFTVRTLREIERADVSVESIGPVPAENIEVRKVRFLPARRGYVDTGTYRVIPDILDRWHGGSLPGDDNTTFWLTLRVPEDAPPGIYRGQIRFTADGTTALIPVLLRVLDADLQEDPDHTYGIYYTNPLSRALSAPDDVSRRHWERKAELEHADMVAHGTRNIVLSCWSPAADENGEFDLSGGLAFLEAALNLAERFEFQQPYMVSISTESVYEKYMGESLKSHLRDVK
ncbi:MAG: hypothetical protein MUQ26_03405, partial [Armatimonadetes bacterium]|nr:hypothetical protein [Armatimonadota bacterium]